MKSDLRQERDHIPSRRIATIAAIALVVTVLGIAVAVFPLRDRSRVANSPVPPRAPPTFGIVEQHAIENAHRATDLRAAQHEALDHYRFLDASHDQAEIPIDRAMQIIAEKKK